MRILLASMPLVALTAILSCCALHRIDSLTQIEAMHSGDALPETVIIFRRIRAKQRMTASGQRKTPARARLSSPHAWFPI